MPEETSKPMPRIKFTDSNANSFSDKVLRWELLQSRLEPIVATMPHVKPVYDELVQLITQAKQLVFEQEARGAAAQKASSDRKEMIQTGDGIRSRLASALAFEHGSTSVLLKEFGLRPRRPGTGRKKVSPPPETEPAPPPVEVQAGTHAAPPTAEAARIEKTS
jgi:hypothetical protein